MVSNEFLPYKSSWLADTSSSTSSSRSIFWTSSSITFRSLYSAASVIFCRNVSGTTFINVSIIYLTAPIPSESRFTEPIFISIVSTRVPFSWLFNRFSSFTFIATSCTLKWIVPRFVSKFFQKIHVHEYWPK